MTSSRFAVRSWWLASVVLLFGADGARSQVTWTKVSLPGHYFEVDLAYDARRRRVVMVGDNGALETHEWNGAEWFAKAPANTPPWRTFAMEYHATRQQTVLLNSVVGLPNQTISYEWNGGDWTRRWLGIVPSGRYNAKMAYDSARQRVVLFGGQERTAHVNDTWEWDGNDWAERFPANAPSGRSSHAMAYDSTRGCVVLFGGPDDETWEYDGIDWSQRSSVTVPLQRWGHAMEYDPVRRCVVMFGGGRYSGKLSDTWEWDGSDWKQRFPATVPRPRTDHGMVWDAARQHIVMRGGSLSTPSTTWAWDGVDWRDLGAPRLPGTRTLAATAYDADRDRVVMFGGSVGSLWPGAIDETWEWDGRTWVEHTPAQRPVGRTLTAMAYDRARKNVVLFGGLGQFGALGDTWTWDGVSWTQQFPVTSPDRRSEHGMAYDPVRQRVVLFGGMSFDGARSDTWEWDGANWAQRAPPHSPSPRGTTMAYDVARQRAVIFGGSAIMRTSTGTASSTITYVLDETWEWDGDDWSMLQPTTKPSGRDRHTMVYDAARERVVMYGTFTRDLWEWDGSDWQLRIPSSPLSANSSVMGYHGGTERVFVLDRGFGGMWEYHTTSPGSYTTFGVGCGGPSGTPRLAAANGQRPWIGAAFEVELTQLPPSAPAFLFVGVSNTQWGAGGLPLGLGLLGLPSCFLHISPDLTLPLVSVGGTARWTVSLSDPALRGLSFYNQGGALLSSTSPWLVLSNGGCAVIGAR